MRAQSDTLPYMIETSNIGQTVAALRQQRGLSQEELRRRTGVNIWRLENGQFNPLIETLQKIARELGVPVSSLLD